MRDVFVITHTESEHHVQRRVGGWYDTDLTVSGRQQAQSVARALEARFDGREPHIVASDLLRARSTAEIIGGILARPVLLDRRFREMSFGSTEGLPVDSPGACIVHAPPDGNRLDHAVCEGAETRRGVATRIGAAMADLERAERPCTVIVTHGFALTFVISAWIGVPPDAMGRVHFRATPGGITHMHEDDTFGSRSLESLNDTAHLQTAPGG